MDIDQLHRELAKAILAADAEADKDTAAFVREFLAGLDAGADSAQLTEGQTAELAAWAARGVAGVKAGIAQAIQIGGQAGSMTSEQAARLAEEAFTRTWQDGRQLSTRLWSWQAGTPQGVTQALQQGIRQMRGVSQTVYDMQRAIEVGANNHSPLLFQVVNRHQDDWVSELYSSAQTLIHDPKARAQWLKTCAEIRGHIDELKETGTKHAAERVFAQIQKAVVKGNADLVQNAVHWWIYDKQLYHLKRIVRTEMANAGHAAIIAATQGSEDVIGYQWRLSGSHPRPDICDYYAGIDMGLGKGVWTKDAVPNRKAHPHCMCLIVPRVTPVKTPGSVNYAEFLKNLTPEKRAQLLPKWAQEAMASGTKLEDLIRPDGLGLVARKDNIGQIGQEKFAARQAIGRALAEAQWPVNKIRPGGKMSKDTMAALQANSDVPEVRDYLHRLESGGYRTDSREWHYFKYKYQYGDTLADPEELDRRFEAVLNDPGALVYNKGTRYAIYSAESGRVAVVESNGRRVTVYRPDDDYLQNEGEPAWLIHTMKD